MKDKRKSNQINVRFDPETYERLKRASSIQQHDAGQLCRILVEIALPFYESARSVEGLPQLQVAESPKRKRQLPEKRNAA